MRILDYRRLNEKVIDCVRATVIYSDRTSESNVIIKRSDLIDFIACGNHVSAFGGGAASTVVGNDGKRYICISYDDTNHESARSLAEAGSDFVGNLSEF